ncbi:MAG: LysE family translocator [Woeseiaceae bacterium]
MSSLLALIVATSVLVAIPGPNVALIVATSLRYGFRRGVVSVLGTTAGVALQLAFVLFGMAALIEVAADALIWIKWAGVAYLLWLGLRIWREPADAKAVNPDLVEPSQTIFWRGCLFATINPKTLLFNAAFIPQFIMTESPSMTEVVLVGSTFLGVIFVGDVLWAAFAHSAGGVLTRFARFRNRVTGALLAAAAIGLALARR